MASSTDSGMLSPPVKQKHPQIKAILKFRIRVDKTVFRGNLLYMGDFGVSRLSC